VVPTLWWFEVRNILVVNERRKRITQSDTGMLLRNLSRLRIRLDGEPDEAAVLRLVRTYRLSVNDASYLELALREGVPVATLDAQLAAAATSERAELVGEHKVKRLPRRL
jgi:predicted nucleic acid-binding protein